MKRGLIEWDKSELSEEEFSSRIKKTRRLMRAEGLDAIAVYGDAYQPGNLSYLTNFVPYADTGIFVLPVAGSPKLFTTHAYRNIPWFKTITWLKDIVCTNDLGKDFTDYLNSLDLNHRKIGLIPTRDFPFPIYELLKEQLGCDLIDLTRVFEDLRAVKSNTEMKFTREAAKIAVASYKRLREVFRPGMTGYDLAAEVELTARQSAAEDLLFFIQQDKALSGLTLPKSQAIEELCCVEISIEYKGYWAKLGRTLISDNVSTDYEERNQEFLLRYRNVVEGFHQGQTLETFSQDLKNHLGKMDGVEEIGIYLNPGLEPYWTTNMKNDRDILEGMVLYVKAFLRYTDCLPSILTNTYAYQDSKLFLLTEF